jgi:hypothetical protein
MRSAWSRRGEQVEDVWQGHHLRLLDAGRRTTELCCPRTDDFSPLSAKSSAKPRADESARRRQMPQRLKPEPIWGMLGPRSQWGGAIASKVCASSADAASMPGEA